MRINKLKSLLAIFFKNVILNRKYSVGVLLFFVFSNFLAFYLITKLETHYSLDQFQPKHHGILTASKKVRQQFLISEANPYIISLSLKDSNSLWTDTKNMNRLQQLTDELAESDKILDITSLSNIETAVTKENTFTLGTVRELASVKDTMANPLLTPNLISKNGQHTALVITPETLSTDEHTALFNELSKQAKSLGKDVIVQVGGPSAIRTQVTNLLSKEIVLFTLFSLGVSILILSLMFRGFIAPIMTLLVVISANLIAMSMMVLFNLPLTVLTNTVPILITITVVAISTHSLIKLGELARKKSQSKVENIFSVFKELIGPHILTALTTAIGFGTLITSDVPIISSYGLSVAVCVLVACFVTLIMLPALLMWLPAPEKREWQFSNLAFILLILKNKRLILSVLTIIFVGLAITGQNLNWSALLFDDLPSGHESRTATSFVDKHLGGTVPLDISIGSKDLDRPWKNPENLLKLDLLTSKIRESHAVGSIASLTDFIKMAHPQKTIPDTSKAVSEMYFVYAMGQENPLEAFITPNGQHTRLTLRMRDVPSKEAEAEIDRIKQQAKHLFPEMNINVAGTAATVHVINEELSEKLMFGFFEALIWIVLLLSLIFRSLSWALFSVIPNLLPPVFLLGALAITKTPIKPNIAIIFAISLGIAFDNTVYILSRLKHLLKNKPHSPGLVRRLLRDEMGPCFVSSFSLMAGFSIFMLSYFTMNKIFGAFMLLSIGAGLLGDLVLLPIVLSLFPQALNFSFTHGILIPTVRFIRMLPIYQKATAGLFIILTILFGIHEAEAAKKLTADYVLNQVKKNNSAPNEKADIKMIIKERDGSTKEREIVIKKKNTDEQKALVKLLKPADLKGVGLLTVSKGKGDETQWVYLPSEKRPRRVVASNKSGKFLDSDLSYEDMSIATYENFNNSIEKIQKNGKVETAVLLSMAKDKNASSYGKIKTWIDTKSYRILQSQYYDHKGKLVKKMKFTKYKKYGSVWRAGTITVNDVKKNRSTILHLKKVSLKTINDGELSMSALEAG